MNRSVHRYPERGCGLAPCSSSPTALSCLLHWFRRSSALKETQGRVEDSNLHRLFFLFLSHFHPWSLLFLNKGGKTLPFTLKRGTNKVFSFFGGKGLACEWRLLRLFFFFSPLPSLPPPVKPSDNSGADRLARNKEGARGEEGEFDSFFKTGTKYPPLFLPLCVSLSSHYISLFTIAQFIFCCSGISHLKETSSSRVSWAFDWELDGLNALALWYPSTCHCPSSSPIFSSVLFLP